MNEIKGALIKSVSQVPALVVLVVVVYLFIGFLGEGITQLTRLQSQFDALLSKNMQVIEQNSRIQQKLIGQIEELRREDLRSRQYRGYKSE